MATKPPPPQDEHEQQQSFVVQPQPDYSEQQRSSTDGQGARDAFSSASNSSSSSSTFQSKKNIPQKPIFNGFDSSNLVLLKRMEDVATVWLNMLVQQPAPLEQDEQRNVDFCTKTLQHLLSEGGFRSYTTPPPFLYARHLPSLRHLPCMVVTLKYWYTALLSRCQYQTAMSMLPERLFHPGELTVSVEDYLLTCEAQARQWLGFCGSTASSSRSNNNRARPPRQQQSLPSQMSPTHAALWMHQLQTKQIPHFSPVKASCIIRLVPEPSSDHENCRMPSPTDVMMFDAHTGREKNSNHHTCIGKASDADEELAAIGTTKELSSLPGLHQPVNLQPTEQRAKEDRMRRLIISLYHASKCNNDETYPCPVHEGCSSVKRLWQHIIQGSCTCTFESWCGTAKEALLHYGSCKSTACNICGPVLMIMPQVKHDILVAAAAAKRQAEVVEEAILQVTSDLTTEACSTSKPLISHAIIPQTTMEEWETLEGRSTSPDPCDGPTTPLKKRPAASPITRKHGGGPFKKRTLTLNAASFPDGCADTTPKS